ncbi:dethiobiotin synthase [Candidatus Sororendozoicomonas aggregata]|uniref:dethiobiotin synthase n=1 Tax=Candidatus Sororendozoicomonas aggregata TaxID=3073239 RepID=UPI002ED09204
MGKKIFFITGTDTDAGKTFVTRGLLRAANQRGLKTQALKPVSAGCQRVDGALRNDDALDLMAVMNTELSYEQMNPVAAALPASPHIALVREEKRITMERLAGFCRGALMKPADFVLVEGAGGWRVPLNDREMMSELPKILNIPVILVVGVRLGCLNHARLTAEAIINDGVKLAGWVANCLNPEMIAYDENIQTLHSLIPAPCLGEVPFLADGLPEQIASYFDLSTVL